MQRGERRRVAARRRELAEGEIDAADERIDERIGRRQQRVDHRERQPADRQLQAVSDRVRHNGKGAQVAERRGIGASTLRIAEPVANEKEELRFRQGLGV